MQEKFASWNKKILGILPVHHDCNPNQENLHKLQTKAASSKIRKMNFCIKIKLIVNSSWILTSYVSQTLMGEKKCFLKQSFYYKILPVHHDCNPNNQDNSHKLQIWTASSKNRKVNFHLDIKLTVNSWWFRLCEPNINNLKYKWSRKIAFIDGERNFLPKI